jgi:uncharacterized protein with HEPN domain
MQRKTLKYVYDMKAAAEKIQRFVVDKSEADCLASELLQSAVREAVRSHR